MPTQTPAGLRYSSATWSGSPRKLDESALALEEPQCARRLGEEHVGAGRVALLGDLQGELLAARVAHGDVDAAALLEALDQRSDELLGPPAVDRQLATELGLRDVRTTELGRLGIAPPSPSALAPLVGASSPPHAAMNSDTEAGDSDETGAQASIRMQGR